MMPLMPRDRIGQFTGLFSVSRGAATVVAPVIFGAGIDAVSAIAGKTEGYATIWPMATAAILVSLFLYRGVTTSQRAVTQREDA